MENQPDDTEVIVIGPGMDDAHCELLKARIVSTSTTRKKILIISEEGYKLTSADLQRVIPQVMVLRPSMLDDIPELSQIKSVTLASNKAYEPSSPMNFVGNRKRPKPSWRHGKSR